MHYKTDFTHVRGHEHAKRALEVALVGSHHIVFVGPLGAGKYLLGQAVKSIVPDTIPYFEYHEHKSLHIPQRHPGGAKFIYDLTRCSTEFIAESMKAGGTVIGTVGPCPCGYASTEGYECTCNEEDLHIYKGDLRKKLQLFNIHIELPLLNIEKLQAKRPQESNEIVKARIQAGLEFTKGNPVDLTLDQLHKLDLDRPCTNLLKAAYPTVMRSNVNIYYSTIALSRTIASMEHSQDIKSYHMAEAIQYCYRNGFGGR